MCNRLKLQRMRKQVWLGAASGIVVSVALGIAFAVAFYITKSKVMSGPAKLIFKGYINLVAALLITLLAFAMLRFMNYERKWAAKLEDAAAKIDMGRGNQWSIFLLAFTAVFREGVESVIFLAGVSTTTSWTAIPLAGIVGIALGVAVGFALYYTGKQIKDIAWFFILSCIFLFFIAAGLVSLALTSWQGLGWFGTWDPPTDRPWWNRPSWDWSACCSSRNQFFALMTALFGYQARPTPISLIGYFGFWAIILLDVGIKWARGTLTDAAKGKQLKGVPEGALSSPGGGATGGGAVASAGASGSDEEASVSPSEPPALLGDIHVPAVCGKGGVPPVKGGSFGGGGALGGGGGDVESQKGKRK